MKSSRILSALCLLAICSLVGLKCIQMYENLGSSTTGDLKRFWAAGGAFATGLNPYNLDHVSWYSITHGGGTIDPLPLFYPATAFVALLPFTLLSFEACRWLYIATSTLTFLCCFILPVISWHARQGTSRQIFCALTHITSYVLFLPLLIMVWVGALTLIPLLGLLCFFLLTSQPTSRVQRALSGACLALILVKPTALLLVLPYQIPRWLKLTAYAELAGLMTGCLLLACPVILLPESFELILWKIDLSHAYLWQTPNVICRFQTWLDLNQSARLLPTSIAIIYATWRGFRSPQNEEPAAILCLTMIPLGLVITPFAWTYDFVPLLFTIAYILDETPVPLLKSGQYKFSPSSAVLLINNALLWFSPLAMALHWWYPIGVWSVARLKSIELANQHH